MNVALALGPLKTDMASIDYSRAVVTPQWTSVYICLCDAEIVINTQPPSISQLQMFVPTIKSYDTQNILGRSDHVKYFFGSFIEVICYGDR